MKALIIINPASRGGRHGDFHKKFRAWVEAHLENVRLEFTKGPAHATELADRAAAEGIPQIWSVGGDGTLNEIINGIGLHPENRRPAVGVVSRGTGGDFARRLREIYPGTRGWDWMEDTRTVSMDLGAIQYLTPQGEPKTRYFANVADVGLSGEVVRRVNSGSKKLGSLEYVFSTLAAAWHYRPPKVRLRGMEGQGFPDTMPLLLFIIANGRYFGSGMCIAPEAEWDDGHFQILAAPKVSYLSLLTQLPHLYRQERLTHGRVYYGSVAQATLESLEGPLSVDVDGEFLSAQELTFNNQSKGLKILVPRR